MATSTITLRLRYIAARGEAQSLRLLLRCAAKRGCAGYEIVLVDDAASAFLVAGSNSTGGTVGPFPAISPVLEVHDAAGTPLLRLQHCGPICRYLAKVLGFSPSSTEACAAADMIAEEAARLEAVVTASDWYVLSAMEDKIVGAATLEAAKRSCFKVDLLPRLLALQALLPTVQPPNAAINFIGDSLSVADLAVSSMMEFVQRETGLLWCPRGNPHAEAASLSALLEFSRRVAAQA